MKPPLKQGRDKNGRFLKSFHASLKTEFKKGHKPLKILRGSKHPNFGKRRKETSNWKGGKPCCEICGKILSDYRNKRCQSCSYRGSETSNWQGGRTSLIKSIRHLAKYYKWRRLIFERDNFTCVICGIKNKKGLGKTVRLEADHFPKNFHTILKENNIKTLKEALNCEELWDTNNGRTLCYNCHNKFKIGRPK